MNKKAFEMSLQVVVVAILVLVILVVLLFIFMRGTAPSIETLSSCPAHGGICTDNCDGGFVVSGDYCKGNTAGTICCQKLPGK